MSNAIYEHGRSLDLSRFDEDFRAAKVDPEAGGVPDGTYQVVIESVDIGQSQAGNPKITWALRITGPQAANRVLFKTNGISENNLHILKQELRTCGLELDRLSDLPRHKDRMLDVQLEVTKRTRNGSANIYFDRRLSGAPAAAGDGDDLPF
jgi:hypothetical protein